MTFNKDPGSGRWVMGGSGNGGRHHSSNTDIGPLFGKYSNLIGTILLFIGLLCFGFLLVSIFVKMFVKSYPGIFIFYGFIGILVTFLFAKEKDGDLFGDYTDKISGIFAFIALLCFIFFLVSIFLTIFIKTFSGRFIIYSFLLFLAIALFSKIIRDEPLLDFD